MNAEQPNAPVEDAAWISVDLPLSREQLFASLQNVERLFRLNPHVEILSWKEQVAGPLANGQRFLIEDNNELNGRQQTRIVTVCEVAPGGGYTLSYGCGLKQSTVIGIEELGPSSSRLTVKDCYPARLSEAEREGRLAEVDKSLVAWGDAIRRYFVSRKSWGWLPYHGSIWDRFWLTMPPRQRRIVRLIIWVGVAEFVVFLFVFFIYWLEMGRA